MLRADSDIPYRDGAENRLLDIVRQSTDISSDSAEMLAEASGWAQQYHTHPARANILRSVDIPATAKVLEIGSGCGPLTRYLGEVASLVDAVEPVPMRARVGRERTRDQPHVEVFAGTLEDVPTEPAYDVVVVVGVLEYVADGAADPAAYVAFLEGCRARLVPGGQLVVAIENKLGVKYLTGAGEDHSGRIFDSLEDYPRGTPARTFSLQGLSELISAAGLFPRVYSVFPDYKHTRTVFDPVAMSVKVPSLIEDLPSFPSRFAGTRSLPLASERRLWRELVRDGVAAHFPNSFLIIATATDADATLWPEDRLAVYFSIDRRREYTATSIVHATPDGVKIERTYADVPGPMISRGMTTWDYASGTSFLEVFLRSDEAERRAMLRQWVSLVDAYMNANHVAPLDLIPTNLIVADDGELTFIDDEFHADAPIEQVVDRGLFWMAHTVMKDTAPELWAPATTIGDVFRQLASLLDITMDATRVSRFLEDEAAFQAAVTVRHLGPRATHEARDALVVLHDRSVWASPLGRRLHHDHDNAVSERDRLLKAASVMSAKLDALRQRARARKDALVAERQKVARLRQKLSQTRAELLSVQSSRAFRAARRIRRTFRIK
ncbi:class I SAM-dependent methyltransferase [Aeromicrobium choanae]|uniref:Methyltransferase domain-containing protein n=1 Tax=Aeromicrobium choanae TaxID=1736691 RepID=A0A1T4YXL2_9ACTN|nr:methyltransferase [Aeromicrobium choanae]SKB06466.1 Methyltransferase domain-containing protein [Aeromicrobium choanae]